MLGIQLVIAFVIGGGIGLLVGWLLGGRKQTVAPSDARLENELRQQLAQRESEITQTREQLSQSKNFARDRAGKSGGGGKNSRGTKIVARTNFARREGRAGKSHRRFARGVQGDERRRTETIRAGIFAAGGTVVRQISGNRER